MAATAQAHDEARHYQVIADYLDLLGGPPTPPPAPASASWSASSWSRCTARQLVGMQLLVEPVALTLFTVLRRSQACPVLSDLLPYLEQDEARHVNVGASLLPQLIERMGPIRAARFWLYQMRLFQLEIAGTGPDGPAHGHTGFRGRRCLSARNGQATRRGEPRDRAARRALADGARPAAPGHGVHPRMEVWSFFSRVRLAEAPARLGPCGERPWGRWEGVESMIAQGEPRAPTPRMGHSRPNDTLHLRPICARRPSPLPHPRGTPDRAPASRLRPPRPCRQPPGASPRPRDAASDLVAGRRRHRSLPHPARPSHPEGAGRAQGPLGDGPSAWLPLRWTRGDGPSHASATPCQASTDRFVGREEELGTLSAHLTNDPPRPVLIHGPGGAGKTRLALEFLERTREDWATVTPIDLAADRDRVDVVVRVASTFGIQLPAGAGTDHETRIARALAHRTPGVILLDNLEQLAEPARELLADWIRTAPRHAWLATSRDLVDLPGAVRLAIPPLQPASAVDLFLARGAAAGAPIPSTDDPELHSVMAVLEGSPLAIELAAARLPLLSLVSMRDRLSDGLTLLSGRRTGSPRHRSMATATAWSWGLLDEDERLVLMAGALFPQSFTLDAVESIIQVVRPSVDTLSTMHGLMDLSLLQTAAAQVEEHRGRLSYARPVRAFVLRQLRDSPLEAPLAAAFADTMRAILNRARRLIDTWDADLAREVVLDLPALDAALVPPRTEREDRIALGRLCHAVYALHRSARILDSLGGPRPDDGLHYWQLFFHAAPRARIGEVLAEGAHRPALARGGIEAARMYRAVGAAYSELGDMSGALSALQHARDIAPEDDRVLCADIACSLAVLHVRTGDIDRAEIEVDAALTAARGESAVHRFLPAILDLRGYLHTQRSRFDLAIRHHIEAEQLARELNMERMRVGSLCNLGSTLQESGDFETALTSLDTAVELASFHGDPAIATAVGNRGLTYLHLGDTVRARRDLRSVDRASAGPYLHTLATLNEAAVDAAEHRWADCRATAERVLTALEDMPELTVVLSAGLLWRTLACGRLGDTAAVQASRARQAQLPHHLLPQFLLRAWQQVEADINGELAPVPEGAHALVKLVSRIRRGPAV